MTFAELQAAVSEGAFATGQLTDVKRWINFIYGQLWNADKWFFTLATANVTVTAGALAVSGMPADFIAVDSLLRDDGGRLVAIRRYRRFAEQYIGTDAAPSGLPVNYTILNGLIQVGPVPLASSSTYLLVYERGVTPLAADGDVPAIPQDLHQALVDGAKGEGFRYPDPARSAQYTAGFAAAVDGARTRYLRDLDDVPDRWPADDLGDNVWGY